MRKSLVVLTLSGCAFSSGAFAQVISPSGREAELTASGRGETRLTPDYAFVTIGVTNQASNAVEAAAENARRFDAVIGALHAFGLTDRQLLTSRFNLEPTYEYPKSAAPRVSGFTARSTVRAEVRRLDDLGKIIDASIAGGATSVMGVQFLATNTDSARRSAMTEAVRQARLDADAMARAAGGSLGRLLSLSSGAVVQPIYTGRDMAQLQNVVVTAAAAMPPSPPPTTIVPGELIVSAQVFGRWEFLQGASR
jgi:hypothetical protein